ncbi:uncharacterized protein VTP21DRAFT_10357 [Calcarisporiella thermophila]|uniref:uncharacterized protein n=1 Tax=Calcarisporiella thermophila TaxID=911321 RepID=UPI003743CC18
MLSAFFNNVNFRSRSDGVLIPVPCENEGFFFQHTPVDFMPRKPSGTRKVEGHLFLTSHRLIFRPTSANAPFTSFCLPLANCFSIRRSPTLSRSILLDVQLLEMGNIQLEFWIKGRNEDMFKEYLKMVFETAAARRIAETHPGARRDGLFDAVTSDMLNISTSPPAYHEHDFARDRPPAYMA